MCATIAITVKMMKLVMKILWNSLASCSLKPDKDITSPPKRPEGQRRAARAAGISMTSGMETMPPGVENSWLVASPPALQCCTGSSCRPPCRECRAAARNPLGGYALLAGSPCIALGEIAKLLRCRDADE